MIPAPDLQKTRAKGKGEKEKMIDFETYHAQKEALRRQGDKDAQTSGYTEVQKYIERAMEQRRREVDYISWLLENGAEKRTDKNL